MSASKGRRGHEEEHENHERWLVTYADMVTLLMVLFIVMFAMSAVDEKKFNALKAGLAAGFGQSTSVLDGSSSILEQPGTSIAAPIAPNQAVADLPPGDQKVVQDAVTETQRLAGERAMAGASQEVERLRGVWREIRKALAAQGLAEDVTATIDERGLVLSLVSRHVVFEPDMAELSPRGQRVVTAMAPVLAGLTDPLDVDGHTNQVKVKPKFYASDWELSAARAVRVLRFLQETGDVPGRRMTASAYGHEKPLVDPRKPGSQDVNKRVDIVVHTALPDQTRHLLAQAAQAGATTGGAQR